MVLNHPNVKFFGASLRGLDKTEVKVAQLAGFVSDKAAYHHGEMSLNGAIIGMAQDFVGSNNINVLKPNGQFGSRLRGGKDAASPRYIWTEFGEWTTNYKEFLERQLETESTKKNKSNVNLLNYTDNNTDKKVYFDLEFTKGFYKKRI